MDKSKNNIKSMGYNKKKIKSNLDNLKEENKKSFFHHVTKSFREVWYWAIKGKETDIKDIKESYNKWMEEIKIKFPQTEVTVTFISDEEQNENLFNIINPDSR